MLVNRQRILDRSSRKHTTSFFPCRNDTELAINLENQDYEAIRFCQPPVVDQYYSIGLRLRDISTTCREKCSNLHSYFWKKRSNKEIDCVNNLPTDFPKNFDGNRYYKLASVFPGRFDQIYNATWTRCTSV